MDRVAAAEAELEPLFARLTDVERSCDELDTDAEQAAAAIREFGATRAQAALADAEQRRDAERVAAAVAARQQHVGDTAGLLTEAEAEARAIRERGAEQLPEYVERVVSSVRAFLAEPVGPPAERCVR